MYITPKVVIHIFTKHILCEFFAKFFLHITK